MKQNPEDATRIVAPQIPVSVQAQPIQDMAAQKTHEMATSFPNIKLVIAVTGQTVDLYAKAEGGAGSLPANKEIIGHGGGDWVRPLQSTRLLRNAAEVFLRKFVLATDDEEARTNLILLCWCYSYY